jgi:hypothetical protein
MKIKMDQPVKWDEGIIKTPREMVDNGMAYIREFPNFMGKRRAVLVESRYGSVEVSGYVKASYI